MYKFLTIFGLYWLVTIMDLSYIDTDIALRFNDRKNYELNYEPRRIQFKVRKINENKIAT